MVFHYETQPNPNPLSWYFHHLPAWFHSFEVAFNHVVELIAPWFVFGPRRARHVAGGLIVVFQVLTILSGNLSFLNWLTIAPALACFDDGLIMRLAPGRMREWLEMRSRDAEETKARAIAVRALAVVIALLSINPVVNMLSPRQVMNTSFDPFELVNTYGAFGSIGRERYEIVLEGTVDEQATAQAHWVEYQFKCKPSDPMRRPCPARARRCGSCGWSPSCSTATAPCAACSPTVPSRTVRRAGSAAATTATSSRAGASRDGGDARSWASTCPRCPRTRPS